MEVDSQLESKADYDLEVSLVEEEELLYRRIFSIIDNEVQHYRVSLDGGINFSTMAFSDTGLKPSVDRALLNSYDPTKTKLNETDGVIGLITKNVRAIDDVSSEKDGTKSVYKIDVIHRPKPDNKAHAQVEPSPEYSTQNIFNKKCSN